MSFDELLGRSATLAIRRFGSPGAFLAIGEKEDLLLIGSEIPLGAKEGDEVDVFVYLDSEGRPLATTRVPKLELGEVAFLEVTALTDFGAFVDWGLQKELLVPFAEQTADMRVGSRYAIGLYVDETGRLAGTMRVSEMLGGDKVEWKLDEWVEGEAWRVDPEIGLFVIVERAFVGLVPAGEPQGLARGDAARFRVTNVLPDGKIELSLRGHAHEELANDAQRILAVLAKPKTPKVGDRSSPEEIKDLFGLSKKAFKRAVGRLLKEGSVAIDGEGFVDVRGEGTGKRSR
jgi:predicted RNA-binding protein (virulence factor B family)